MVLCPFYMQGRCKFGDRCYNEHPKTSAPEKNAFLRIDKKLFENLVNEVISSEKGNQWPLSCYAPFRDHPAVPNMKDMSSDELRQIYYQAKKENRLGEYASQVAGLIKESDDMRKFLKMPSVELGTMLENILNKKVSDQVAPDSNFSTFRFSADNEKSGSIFGGSSTGQSSSVFSPESSNIFSTPSVQQTSPSSMSIFGGSNLSNNPQSNQNIFSQPTSESIFGNAPQPQNTFQQNIFSSTSSNNKLFQTTGSDTTSFNSFGSAQSSDVPFQQTTNIFNPQQPTSAIGSNLFQSNNSNIFGTSTTSSKSNHNENVYSDIEMLTEDEKAMFLAPKFVYQKIPLHPPPECYCK